MMIRKFKEHLTPTVPIFYIGPKDPRCKFVAQETGTGACGMLKNETGHRAPLRRIARFHAKMNKVEGQARKNGPRFH